MKSSIILKLVKQEYKQKRNLAQEDADATLTCALNDKDFAAVSSKIANLNFTIATKRARKQDTSIEETELTALNKQRASILKKMKLSDADFEPKFACPVCHDEGVVNGDFCKCFEKRYYEILKDYLNIESALPCSFDTVNFADVKDENQRIYLEKLYGVFKKYAEKFPKVNTLNALISGGTGVGKSYLMSAVADKLEKRGYNVIFISAVQLNKLMLNYHIASASERNIYLADILDCNMLIIDDLGSEQKLNNVTEEYLLLILNEREIHHKPVFITTNLSQEQMKLAYNERLFSRIANKKTTIIKEIVGVDLRLN